MAESRAGSPRPGNRPSGILGLVGVGGAGGGWSSSFLALFQAGQAPGEACWSCRQPGQGHQGTLSQEVRLSEMSCPQKVCHIPRMTLTMKIQYALKGTCFHPTEVTHP